jgi:hypothetical protein
MKKGTEKTRVERDPDIAHYEAFLKAIGFKRTDGAIFGLLVLSAEPLSSEEIGKTLGLSQGAVSQGLKNLSHWGAVESRYSPERRAQLHGAVQDSLSIVATVFQKREKGAIENFRRVNELARDRFLAAGASPESPRIQRLNSYITTCEFGQVVMDFAIALSRVGVAQSQYSRVIRTLPRLLGAVVKGPKMMGGLHDEVMARVKGGTLWR